MIYSSGIVVVRKEKDKWQCLMLNNGGIWDFPKGKLEENENFIQAALRETKEESNVDNLSFDWGFVFFQTKPYQKGKKRKTARYYLARMVSGEPRIMPNLKTGRKEHQFFSWFYFSDLPELQERINLVADWANSTIKGK